MYTRRFAFSCLRATADVGGLVLALLLIVNSSGCSLVASRFYARTAKRLDPAIELLSPEANSLTLPEALPASPDLESTVDRIVEPAPTPSVPESIPLSESVRTTLPPTNVTLSLDEARQAALVGNFDLRLASIQPEVATQRVREEIWKFESTFAGAMNHREVEPPPGSFNFPPPARTIDAFDPRFDFPLLTGGTLTLRQGRSRTSFPGLGGIAAIYDLSPTLSYRQPLLRNAGFNLNMVGIRLSHLDLQRADANVKLTAIGVLAQVERQYWFLYAAQRSLEVAEQQVQIARKQLEDAQKLVDAGVVSKVEILRSQAGVSERLKAVVNARLEVLLQMRELKFVAQMPDLPVDSPTQFQLSSAPNLIGLTFDRSLLSERALSNRMDLLDLELQLAKNNLTIQATRNQSLPEFDLVFDGSLLGTGPSDPAAIRQSQTGEFSNWFAGFTFSIPLAGNQSARSRVRQATWDRAQTQVAIQAIRTSIVKQVYDASDRFEQAWAKIIAARQSVLAAQDTYEAETRLFELGERTSDLVLLAAERLGAAQLDEILAIVEIQVARVELAVATGTMLGYSSAGFPEEIPLPDQELPPPVEFDVERLPDPAMND